MASLVCAFEGLVEMLLPEVNVTMYKVMVPIVVEIRGG